MPACGFEIESIEKNEGFFNMYAQESLRFASYIDPRKMPDRFPQWVLLGLLWVLTAPLMKGLLPLIGPGLDRLELEDICTHGYHVVARRSGSLPG